MIPRTPFPSTAELQARMKQEFAGKVSSIKFYDPDSHAIIASLVDGTTVKGETEGEPLELGTAYRFFGKPSEHPKYGRQFSFDTYTLDTPHEKRGVISYLVKEATGVGQATAVKLWEAYGSGAIEVLRTDPVRVARDGLMDDDDAAQAAADLERGKLFEKTRVDLFNLFAGRGFSRTTISRCIELWGVKAADYVRRNPFTMLVRDIGGAGWKRCDKLYIDLGHNPNRLKRQCIAGWAALREGVEGNTWHPFGAFNLAVVKAVGAMDARFEQAAQLGIRAGWLAAHVDTNDRYWLAEAEKAKNEADLVSFIWRLQQGQASPWPAVDPAVVSEHQYLALAPHREANVLILAGTPGTGKTYTAAALLRELVAEIGAGAIAVCAPTGKAAVRITEAMNKYRLPLVASTIHSLLGINRNGHDGRGWDFSHNEQNPLPRRVIVVDEVSMLDTDLAASLFRACDHGTKVLLIGDPYQLPPVGHGAPLRDLIAAGVPCATLSEIQRNAGTIVEACASIKDGKRFATVDKLDEDTGKNLRLIECADADAQVLTLSRVIAAIQNSGKRDAVWDVQVLCPRNEETPVSRVVLNAKLQALLNPLPGDKAEYQAGEFRRGDKIICLRNCLLQACTITPPAPAGVVDSYRPALDQTWQPYRVYLANGDIGRVDAIDVKAKTIVATFFHPDRTVKIPLGKPSSGDDGKGEGAAKDFGLAYAITGHKSQGSEWPMVIVMVDDLAGNVACREWVYTAISRASKACLLIGKRATIDRQCSRKSLEQRKTFLKELLCREARSSSQAPLVKSLA